MVDSPEYACQLVLVEAGGRVEGEVGRYRRESLRIQRERSLQPLDGIGDDQPEQAEDEERERVLQPGLLLARIDAAESAQEPLDRPEQLRKRLAHPFEDPVQVHAERLRE